MVNLNIIAAQIDEICANTGLVFSAPLDNDPGQRRILFVSETSDEQRKAAQALFDAWDADAPIPPSPPVPTLCALADLTISDGDISGIEVNSNLSGAFCFGVGEYWVFFSEPQPDTRYLALVYDGGGAVRAFVRPENKFTDFFIITVIDFNGVPTDVASLSLEIKRVI